MSSDDAVIEGREIIVFGVGDGPGHFAQDRSQVGIAFGGVTTEPFATNLLVARTVG
jgi:hypothetical protein